MFVYEFCIKKEEVPLFHGEVIPFRISHVQFHLSPDSALTGWAAEVEGGGEAFYGPFANSCCSYSLDYKDLPLPPLFSQCQPYFVGCKPFYLAS